MAAGAHGQIDKWKCGALCPALVTPEGFEPPTNRTGICHSIQLNYGSSVWICCANVLLSVKCEFCKSLSTILLSDFITIRVHENRKINFECQIRGECYVNVFSEVIRGNFMLSS